MNNYISYSDDENQNFRYEGLARFAFNCKKYEGPNNIAAQEAFDTLFIPEVTLDGFKAINNILDAIIDKNISIEINHELEFIKSNLRLPLHQSSVVDLIDYVIKIIMDE